MLRIGRRTVRQGQANPAWTGSARCCIFCVAVATVADLENHRSNVAWPEGAPSGQVQDPTEWLTWVEIRIRHGYFGL